MQRIISKGTEVNINGTAVTLVHDTAIEFDLDTEEQVNEHLEIMGLQGSLKTETSEPEAPKKKKGK